MTVREWRQARDRIESWQRADAEGPPVVFLGITHGTLEIRSDVPATRADCPKTRPCGHVRCRWHLWRVDGGVDGNRAGRPGLSMVPRNKRGLTLAVTGDTAGERAGTTLEARWLETPLPPSCCLDEVDLHGKMTNEQTGQALGRHRTLVAREVRGALGKAIETAEELGIERQDLMRALMNMGRL